jgi:hypothetical protein
MCEVVPGEHKRCIRPHEHTEGSHVWIESLDRVGGAPRIVIWTDGETPKIINAYVIVPEAVEEIDRMSRAYGWEVGHGKPLTQTIEDLSEDNPFLQEDWKERMVG